jgi:hypothetical protein
MVTRRLPAIVIVDGHIVVYDFDFIFNLSVGCRRRTG